MSHRILVIEDNRDIAALVRMNLLDCARQIDVELEGAAGLARAGSIHYDLIILDLMLPGMEGLEICRRLRSCGTYTPILMLTAKSSELDRVLGLEMGADDYLTKPFSVRELVARVKAIFRRMEALGVEQTRDDRVITHDGLSIDPEKHLASLHGRPLSLTGKEFELLLHFTRNPGRVYRREQLLNHVWGAGYEGYEHTVNSHINRLRAKLEEDPARPRRILTVWGVGYKLAESQTPASARH